MTLHLGLGNVHLQDIFQFIGLELFFCRGCHSLSLTESADHFLINGTIMNVLSPCHRKIEIFESGGRGLLRSGPDNCFGDTMKLYKDQQMLAVVCKY